MVRYSFLFSLCVLLFSCESKKLAILGKEAFIDGKPAISESPEFTATDQFGNNFSRSSLQNKYHIATFFFTSCPTICPKVMRSMMQLEEKFGKNEHIDFVCFSLDYRRDTTARLQEYAGKLGIDNPRFHFIHLKDKEEVQRIATGYMSVFVEDETVPGGIDHSGWILLVDKNFHIRSFALGTDPKEVERFIADIDLLLDEKE